MKVSDRGLWKEYSYLDTLLYTQHTKYSGTMYIVFVFSVIMFVSLSICVYVCVCVCKLFSVKGFSATTLTRILKFDTNTSYDLSYCVRENQHPHTYHSLCPFFSLSSKFFRHS